MVALHDYVKQGGMNFVLKFKLMLCGNQISLYVALYYKTVWSTIRMKMLVNSDMSVVRQCLFISGLIPICLLYVLTGLAILIGI